MVVKKNQLLYISISYAIVGSFALVFFGKNSTALFRQNNKPQASVRILDPQSISNVSMSYWPEFISFSLWGRGPQKKHHLLLEATLKKTSFDLGRGKKDGQQKKVSPSKWQPGIAFATWVVIWIRRCSRHSLMPLVVAMAPGYGLWNFRWILGCWR